VNGEMSHMTPGHAGHKVSKYYQEKRRKFPYEKPIGPKKFKLMKIINLGI
jgi:hypothetical protein